MGDRTIEDMFDQVWDDFPKGYDDGPAPAAYVAALRAATADGPVFSADGSLAVIRTADNDLLETLTFNRDAFRAHQAAHPGAWGESYNLSGNSCGEIATMLDQVLALLAAPAPADPEEDGDEAR